MKPKRTPLHALPFDALHLTLSHLSMHDVLSISAAFPDLSYALAAHLSHAALSPHLSSLRSSFPAMLPHLTRLTVRQIPPHPPVLAAAASLRHLTLTLPHPLSDLHLSQLLRHVPNLSALTVQSTPLPTQFFSLLAVHAQSLVALRLSFVTSLSFADRYVTPLWHAARSTLRSVRLHACDHLDDHFVEHMARHCLALQSVCISAARNVSDHAIRTLCQSPLAHTLRKVHIGDCAISDTSLFALATSCTALSELSVSCCNGVSTWGIRAVAEGLGAFLQRLSIAHCVHVGEEAFVSIADNCDSLSYLRVASLPHFTNDAMMALFDTARLGRMQLRTLHVVDCPCISEVAIAAAAGVLDAHNQHEWRVAHSECEAYTRSDQMCNDNSVCMCPRCDDECCDSDELYEEGEQDDDGSSACGASRSADGECEHLLQAHYDQLSELDKQSMKKSYDGSNDINGSSSTDNDSGSNACSGLSSDTASDTSSDTSSSGSTQKRIRGTSGQQVDMEASDGCADRPCGRWHSGDGGGREEARFYESSVSELYAPDVMVSQRAQQRLRERRRGVRLRVGGGGGHHHDGGSACGGGSGEVAERARECCEHGGWWAA